MDYGLWCPRGKYFSFFSFLYADRACDVDDIKSTSGGDLFIRDYLVSWLRKKQSNIYLSIVEAEYIAAKSCYTQLLL